MRRRRWPQVQWLTRTLPSAGIIKRYCEGFFTPNYKLTIGVDFAVKVVEWDDRTRVSLQVCAAQLSLSDHATAAALGANEEAQLWDVAGHERFGECLGWRAARHWQAATALAVN